MQTQTGRRKSAFDHILESAAADSKAGKAYNFLSLRGGKYLVHPESTSAFFEEYAKEVFEKHGKYYLCEKRGDIFRLFFDIDIQMKTPIIPESLDWSRIAMSITSTLKQFYQPDKLRVVIHGVDGKNKGDNFFVALHIIYPDLYIDTETVQRLLPWIHQRLIQDIPMPDSVVSKWNDDKTLDETPYTTTECFRLFGSDKWCPCKKCKGSPKMAAMCSNCFHQGGFSENRVYYILDILDSDSTPIDHSGMSHLELLHVSVINPYKPDFTLDDSGITPNTVIESPNAQNTIPTTTTGMSLTGVVSAIPGVGIVTSTTDTAAPRVSRKRSSPSDTLTKEVLPKDLCDLTRQFIVETFGTEYENMPIKAIKRNPEFNSYTLIPESSFKYCGNIQDHHPKANIYFIISPRGMQQKCHCRCDKLSLKFNITCKQWSQDPEFQYLRFKTFDESEFHKKVSKAFFKVTKTKYRDPADKSAQVANSNNVNDVVSHYLKLGDRMGDTISIKKSCSAPVTTGPHRPTNTMNPPNAQNPPNTPNYRLNSEFLKRISGAQNTQNTPVYHRPPRHSATIPVTRPTVPITQRLYHVASLSKNRQPTSHTNVPNPRTNTPQRPLQSQAHTPATRTQAHTPHTQTQNPQRPPPTTQTHTPSPQSGGHLNRIFKSINKTL